MFAQLMDLLIDVYVSPHDHDICVWSSLSSGLFTVKSFFLLLLGKAHPYPLSQFEVYGKLWLLLEFAYSHG